MKCFQTFNFIGLTKPIIRVCCFVDNYVLLTSNVKRRLRFFNRSRDIIRASLLLSVFLADVAKMKEMMSSQDPAIGSIDLSICISSFLYMWFEPDFSVARS